MKKILITGASGFVGKHLIELLSKEEENQIFGTYLIDKSKASLAKFGDKLNLRKIDLSDEANVFSMIEEIKPDLIFHLAASTSPAESFNDPKGTIMNNVSTELNILDALKKLNLTKTRVLITSSADIYGKVSEENLPINEDCPLNPTNPYAVSKIAQDFLALQYFNAHNIKTIRVRAFNHVGPGQSPAFVVSAFAKKIAEIEKTEESEITVGNLEAKRDFTDVRDMVKAYVEIIEKGNPGDVYNIGSGKALKISEILDGLVELSNKKITVKVDEKLMRPVDNPELVCDATKIGKTINWVPEIPINKTLEDTLNYWRENL
jgi:GDP-4-dehydro-6-deoxy-D-mannose reductase